MLLTDGFASNGNPPVAVGDESWFYVDGLNLAYEGHRQLSGIRLLTQKRDRWAGIRDNEGLSSCHGTSQAVAAGQCSSGQVTLRPIDLRGATTLTLNLDTASRQNAEVRVELLDSAGWRLAGFTRDRADAIRGVDTIAHQVSWSNGSTTIAAAGAASGASGEVVLRIYLRNASLFAVTVA